MDRDVPTPTLHLERCLDGTFMGRSTERVGIAPEATWVFVGSTPEEIVAQWLDRYATRPHTIALNDVECETLRLLVDREVKVEANTTNRPRTLAVLRGLAERFK